MNKKRLPQSTYPIRYEVELDVDLDNFTYTGKELIDIEVLENTNEIILNKVVKKKKKKLNHEITCRIHFIPIINPEVIESIFHLVDLIL